MHGSFTRILPDDSIDHDYLLPVSIQYDLTVSFKDNLHLSVNHPFFPRAQFAV